MFRIEMIWFAIHLLMTIWLWKVGAQDDALGLGYPVYSTLIYSISPTWLDDEEQNWTVALNEGRWDTWTKEAINLGLTFAGQNEFPFIVDVRMSKKTVDFWSTGNLIKHNTLLTTCRAAIDLGDWRSALVSKDIRVTFCKQYLWEFAYRENARGAGWPYGGNREILSVILHNACNNRFDLSDGALIIMKRPIYPVPPTINTVTIVLDLVSGIMPQFNLEFSAEQRRVCYVGSFGRDYENIKDHIVKDFKVRYRVYWEKMELCEMYRTRMCENTRRVGVSGICPEDFTTQESDAQVMCFKSRAKVGTVCDHDKGAPLVCDGQVFGLVALGAAQRYCNNLLPLPFLVQRITVFASWFNPNVALYRDVDPHIYPESSAESFLKSSSIHRFLPVVYPLLYFTQN